MAAGNQGSCCNIVGSMAIGLGDCIISVDSSAKPELIKECGDTTLYGPTAGTVSVTAYAANTIHVGCPGRAGVSIPWVRRYGCGPRGSTGYVNIKTGSGAAYVAGDVDGLASLIKPTGRTYTILSASAQGGPTSVYMEVEQEDGFGLRYTGLPSSFRFNSTTDDMIFSNFGVGEGDMYMQSFSLDLQPGELPVASFSFAFFIDD